MNNNDVQTGLRVVTQIPLDQKTHFASEAILQDLGSNNNLAFTYYKGMPAYCVAEKTKYVWEESLTGLLPVSFTYPNNLIVNEVDYSNKRYNFVPTIITKVTAGTNITVSGVGSTVSPYIINSTGGGTAPDATNLVKGILKLTNDLGGTADLPTTPTAVHKTGNENISGIKTFSPANSTEKGLVAYSNTTPPAFYVSNTGTNVNGLIRTQNFTTLSGTVGAINFENRTNQNNLVLNTENPGTGNPLSIQLLGIEKSKIDYQGNFTANSVIKTGGTAQQILIADGTVRELNPQKEITANYILTNADDGYVIFINNGTTPVSITINTTVTIPNFSVGFIQEGSADVTFVGAGITLTNPIGLKSKGQGYQTFIERKLATSTYYLLGNTKV